MTLRHNLEQRIARIERIIQNGAPLKHSSEKPSLLRRMEELQRRLSQIAQNNEQINRYLENCKIERG